MTTVSFTWEIQTEVEDEDEILELFGELEEDISLHLQDGEYIAKKTVQMDGRILLKDDIINGA